MTAPPGRHRNGLDPLTGRRKQSAQFVHLVEDLDDDVKRRGEIRAADPEKQSNGLADLRVQRVQLADGADRTIEDEVFRPLVQQLLDAHPVAAVLAESGVGVDFTLHDIEFAVHGD